MRRLVARNDQRCFRRPAVLYRRLRPRRRRAGKHRTRPPGTRDRYTRPAATAHHRAGRRHRLRRRHDPGEVLGRLQYSQSPWRSRSSRPWRSRSREREHVADRGGGAPVVGPLCSWLSARPSVSPPRFSSGASPSLLLELLMALVYSASLGTLDLVPLGPRRIIGVSGQDDRPFLLYIRSPRIDYIATRPVPGRVWPEGPRAHFVACEKRGRPAGSWVVAYDELEPSGFPLVIPRGGRGPGGTRVSAWLLPCRLCQEQTGVDIPYDLARSPHWVGHVRRWVAAQLESAASG